MPVLIAIAGLVLWLPVFFLTMAQGVYLPGLLSYLAGGLNIAAAGPILALVVPSIIRHSRAGSKSTISWAIALTPLLIVVGSMSTYLVRRAIFGDAYSAFADNTSPFIALFLWAIPGWLLHYSYTLRPEQPSSISLSDGQAGSSAHAPDGRVCSRCGRTAYRFPKCPWCDAAYAASEKEQQPDAGP